MDNYTTFQNWLLLGGRILFSFVYVMSGFTKILGFSGTVAYMQSAGITEYTTVLAILAIVFELGGGLLILLGWHARLGALLLFFFTAGVNIGIHHYWTYLGGEEATEMISFLKNVAMMGGALYIISFGAGRYSVDGWFKKA